MKRFLLCLFTVVSMSVFAQSSKPTPAAAAFEFTGINVSQVIQLIYSEVIKTDYVIDPQVLNDQRNVSFRYKSNFGNLKSFTVAFLEHLGYTVQTRDGVDYIGLRKLEESPDAEVFVYRPKYRDNGYLSRLLTPLFKGRFTQNRGIQVNDSKNAVSKDVPQGSAAAAIEQSADVLIFQGSVKEIAQLKSLYSQIDLPPGQVLVRAVVYEVSSSRADGSAIQLLSSVLTGRLGVQIDSAATALPNQLRIKVGGIDAIMSALATDSRFNVVTQPRLRVKSGDTSKLIVGQDVPVLGSVTYQQGGGAVQAVDYRSSGAILDITPTVRDDSIDVRVQQQLSNFVLTDTGVNQSPTLIKRELQTSINAQSGDVIVLGGLTETKKTDTKRGLGILPFWTSKQTDDSTTDVLIVFQVDKV
jgi:general secretion pathway protein D